LKTSRGLPVKRFYPFSCVWLKLVNSIKNCRKNPKIANPIFLCSLYPKLQLCPKVYIFLSFSSCLKYTNAIYLYLWFCKIYNWSWAEFWICCEYYYV
jgi:hypothetical protein